MIIGSDLAHWLRDREGQRRTRAAMSAFGNAWSEGPYSQTLRAALARAESKGAETVAAIASSYLESDWAEPLIEALSAQLRHNPFFDPPFRHLNSDIHSGLVLFEDDFVSIAMGVTDVMRLAAKKTARRKRTSIIFSGQMEVFRFVRSGEARLAFWNAAPIQADFSAAQAGRCTCVGSRRIKDGEMLVVDGRRESFVIEQAETNLFVLQAAVKTDRAPVSVEYDAASHEYVGCSAADDSASRIQMITTLLRKLDHETAVPAMVEFLDHPSFFVRWHVMRELLGLDLRAALPHLKRMAALDAHPETRRAARTALDRIETPVVRRRAA